MENFTLEPGDQVVFTSLETIDKNDLAQAVATAGYVVGPGVSKKTSLLVAGDPSVDSTKARKARDYGIPVIGEREFVDTFLGGALPVSAEAPELTAPASLDDLPGNAKRDLPAVKLACGSLREDLPVQALVKTPEAGTFVVRGPARYSALGEAWMVGGVAVAGSTKAPDKVVRALGLAGGDESTPQDGLERLDVNHPVYGEFSVYGPVRHQVGLDLVGPWIRGGVHSRD
ncbi:BRCT domain-containing protein [Micrococcaceae bacterium RIT802]|nr:BRCT domain-containing protein [Micrococcaceae bacterium RIT 802]